MNTLIKQGSLRFSSELWIKVIRKNGIIEDLGLVSTRVVTTAGVTYLAQTFVGTGEPENFNYHDCGTGTNAESTGDTALQTPYGGSRAVGVQSNPSAGVYRTVGTVLFAGTFAITEHGIFSASSVGTLWDRSMFSSIAVISGDTIIFTYNLTINAGG